MKVKDLLMVTTQDEFIAISDEKHGGYEYFDYSTTIDDFKKYWDKEVISVDIEFIYDDEYYLRVTI